MLPLHRPVEENRARRRTGARTMGRVGVVITLLALGAVAGHSFNGFTTHRTAVHLQEAVYYPNCATARAAGAAPMRKGEPGYRPALDADNDGIACEPY
jgi:hypothetical protein